MADFFSMPEGRLAFSWLISGGFLTYDLSGTAGETRKKLELERGIILGKSWSWKGVLCILGKSWSWKGVLFHFFLLGMNLFIYFSFF